MVLNKKPIVPIHLQFPKTLYLIAHEPAQCILYLGSEYIVNILAFAVSKYLYSSKGSKYVIKYVARAFLQKL